VIAFIFGTTGELIKIAPVMRRLQDRGLETLTMSTGQQAQQISPMLEDFGLPAPDVWLGHGPGLPDLEYPRQIPGWFTRVWTDFARRRRGLIRQLSRAGEQSLVIVHGDTMTTLLGAMMGRLGRLRVAHIEAGLRSGDWRHPFPEELNRRWTTRLAQLHFAPGERAARNLREERASGEIVDTGHNTILDNLRDIPAGLPPGLRVPDEPFGLVSLHRQELLYNRAALGAILETLRECADRRTRLLFIDHSITTAAVDSAGLGRMFDSERFVRIPRLRYFHFLSLLKASSFLVTDSGGSQEECAFLGHPCLIHRAVTEREAGLGRSVLMSHMDLAVLRNFLEEPERYRTTPSLPADSPSDRIVHFLGERRFVRAEPSAVRASDKRPS
jgi:UDP-N-acetylglucosamine 2-epimerase (non-hydrolysing)